MSGPHPYIHAERGPRLQKVLAEAGVGSRRACEELITVGAVSVNGHVVKDLPAWVDPVRDRIAVEGRRIRSAVAHEYIVLFKPRGVVCTNHDPEGRRRAVDLLSPKRARTRLYPVGRLDMDSSGLLLLTNDGELANRLTHPRFGVHKVYEVTIGGALDDDAVARIRRGLFLPGRHAAGSTRSGGRTSPTRLQVMRRSRDRTRLRIELREGRNRQVRRVLARLGHPVKRLRRIQLGPLRLAGLKPGQWRDLTPFEVEALRKSAKT